MWSNSLVSSARRELLKKSRWFSTATANNTVPSAPPAVTPENDRPASCSRESNEVPWGLASLEVCLVYRVHVLYSYLSIRSMVRWTFSYYTTHPLLLLCLASLEDAHVCHVILGLKGYRMHEIHVAWNFTLEFLASVFQMTVGCETTARNSPS